jgi:hypothetical protein
MKLIISREEIYNLVPKDGKIFSVTFIKGDNTIRHLVGRFGVKKYITGKGLRFMPQNRNMFIMFEMSKEQYRMLYVDKIIHMKINKIEYIIEG